MAFLRQQRHHVQSWMTNHYRRIGRATANAAGATRSISSPGCRLPLPHLSAPLQLSRVVGGWRTNNAFVNTSCGASTPVERGRRNLKMKSSPSGRQPPTTAKPSMEAFEERRFSTTPRVLKSRRRAQRGSINMADFQTIEEAADGAFDKLDDLNPRSLSSFWTRVSQLAAPVHWEDDRAKQRDRPLDPRRHQLLMRQLNSILARTMGGMEKHGKYGPRDLTRTAIGFAKIVRTLDVDVRGGRRRRNEAEQTLHDTFIGPQSRHTRTIFQSIANASVRVLPKCDARCLSDLAYANAIVGHAPILEDGSKLFVHIASKSIPILGQFNPRGLTNLVWSFEQVGSLNPRIFRHLGDHIVSLDHLGKFDAQDLANIASAFARAGEAQPRLFCKVADHIVSLDDLQAFGPLELSNIAWAYATAGEAQPRLFQKLADHIIALENLRSFDPQNVADTVWAFAEAGEVRPRLFRKLADHLLALDDLSAFRAKECSQILWGFATAKFPRGRLYERVSARASEFDSDALDRESAEMLSYAYEKAAGFPKPPGYG